MYHITIEICLVYGVIFLEVILQLERYIFVWSLGFGFECYFSVATWMTCCAVLSGFSSVRFFGCFLVGKVCLVFRLL